MNDRPPWASWALEVPRPPAVIAHGGGNVGRVDSSYDSGADLVEADIWSYRRRLETRHERRVPPTRVLFERWYLKWAPARHPALPDLLRKADGRGGVLLDFKNREFAPELVREAMDKAGDARVCASSQFWPILRLVHSAVPAMEMFYSIDVEPQLHLFLSVVTRDPLPAGVSCNEIHLDEEMVRRFHELGLAVIAWTVDDPARALQLADWGVDAITSNEPDRVSAALATR